MACFLVGAAEAVVVTVVAQCKKHSEQKAVTLARKNKNAAVPVSETAIPWSRKLMWLAYLLWGGVLLLAFEHVWHGEVVPWFPFLTAASSAADTTEMLHEMATIGTTMVVIVTAAWAIAIGVVDAIMKRPLVSDDVHLL